MIRYFDLDDDERAGLTEDQVQDYCKLELMQAGIALPKPPKLLPIPDLKPPTITMFQPSGKCRYGNDERLAVLFETAEQAAQFCKLNPQYADYDYKVGSEHQYARPIADLKIAAVPIMTADTFADHRAQLERAESARESNQKAQREFDETTQKAVKATQDIWNDYREQRTRVARLEQIRATLVEYTAMCKGDTTIARGFVEKLYGSELVVAALGPVEIPF